MTSAKTQTLVAIVVTFNRLHALQVTLGRLLAEAPEELQRIIVCDNASNDGTAEWLAQQSDPRLERLTLAQNKGGAGGFEAALRHARAQHDADWYMLMDDDAFPAEGTVATFHAKPRNDHAVWVSSVRYPDGEICEMNRPWVNPFWSARTFTKALLKGRDAFHLGQDHYASGRVHEVDGGSFVGLFVSRRALDTAGFPRGELFIYADDVLFVLKVRRAGGRAAFDPDLGFLHDCKSLTRDTHLLSPLWKVYFYHRNITLVYRDVAGPVLFWPVLALKYLQWRLKAGAYGTKRAAYKNLIKRAVSDALGNRFDKTPEQIRQLISSQEPASESASEATGQKP